MAEAAHEAPGSATHSESTEAAHEAGLPQLKYEYWPGQIVWLLIIFAVLYTLLAKVFLPRVRGVFDAREAKISGDMASARALRDEAQTEAAAVQAELNAARGKAQQTAADAKAKSLAEAAERQGALEAELNVTLGQAEARIRASRDAAMAQVGAIAGDAAQAIALKLTGKAADKAELAAAVESGGDLSMELLQEAELWVGVGVALFFVLLIVLGVPAAAGKALDARAGKIRSALDEAEALRDEAKALLVELKTRREEVEAQASELLKDAQAEAKRLSAEAKTKLDDQVARRTELAQRRIAAAEQQAADEVKAAAADLAAQLAEQMLKTRLAGAKTDPAVDAAIAQVAARLQ